MLFNEPMYSSIIADLARGCPKIISLETQWKIQADTLKMIMNSFPNLQSLSCGVLERGCLEILVNKSECLRKLELGHVFDEITQDIAGRFPILKELTIHKAPREFAMFAENWTIQQTMMTVIDLDCSNFKLDGLCTIMRNCTKLESITLRGCIGLKAGTLALIAMECSDRLKYLTIFDYFCLSDNELVELSDRCRNLRQFAVWGTAKFTQEGHQYLVTNSVNLVTFCGNFKELTTRQILSSIIERGQSNIQVFKTGSRFQLCGRGKIHEVIYAAEPSMVNDDHKLTAGILMDFANAAPCLRKLRLDYYLKCIDGKVRMPKYGPRLFT